MVLGLVVAGIVALVVMLSSRSRNRPRAAAAATPSIAQAVQQEDRQEILRKLANGEITKDEAEERMGQLGSPVPESMPAPPRTGSGTSKGCLIALLVALLLGPLLLILLVLGLRWFGVRPSVHQRAEHEARLMQELHQRAAEEGITIHEFQQGAEQETVPVPVLPQEVER